jgi:hypothetical protein
MNREIHVLCAECGVGIHHHCHDAGVTEMKEALISLLRYVPEHCEPEVAKAIEKAGRASGWHDKDTKLTKSPLFGGEPWTYGMFGKEDGRTVKALVNRIIRAAGLEPDEVRAEAWRTLEEDDDVNEARAARREKISAERREAIALFKGDAPLSEKVAKLDALLKEGAKLLVPTLDDNDGNGGWGHLRKWVRDQYEGGINEDVNRLRVEALRKVAIEEGIYIVQLYAPSGKRIFARRYATIEEANAAVTSAGKYDPTSKELFRRASYARVGTNVDTSHRYMRDKNGAWIPEPQEQPAAAE